MTSNPTQIIAFVSFVHEIKTRPITPKEFKKINKSLDKLSARHRKMTENVLVNACAASPWPQHLNMALEKGWSATSQNGVPLMASTLVMAHPVQSEALAKIILSTYENLTEEQEFTFYNIITHIPGLKDAVETKPETVQDILILFYDNSMLES